MSKTTKGWFKKIAKKRGTAWKKKLRLGRIDAVLNPSMIRIARLSRKLQQADLAKQVKKTSSTLGAIERGRRLVTLADAKQISKAVSYPLPKLFKAQGKKFIAIIKSSSL